MKPTAIEPPPRDLNRAVVVRPVLGGQEQIRANAARLEEATGLSLALGLDVANARLAPVRQISPRTFLGAGRVDEIKDQCEQLGAGVIVIDGALTPVQQRNLETDIGAKVIDRTGLILEIFGLRAQTKEGKLQVELARQAYERSRLVRTWTHLERQRGGLGKTGGPGETQIELDRRIIADRIVRLKRDLDEVRRTRGLQRRARARAGLPAVVLVGYTNAGKSTLFNRLTKAGVLAKDMLFATLDPTARQVKLPSGRTVIMSDTVGFISDLPHELVEAFRATLEAVIEADLIVHVRDIAHGESEQQRVDVMAVLAQLAKEAQSRQPPVLEVWNKIDLLDEETRQSRLRRAQTAETHAMSAPVALSAATGEGVERLLDAIDRAAFSATRVVTITLGPDQGKVRAQIAASGRILDESTASDGTMTISAELLVADAGRFVTASITDEPLTPAAE